MICKSAIGGVVSVGVGVCVAVGVAVAVDVGVYVSVGWFVFGGFEVGVGIQGRDMTVLVGIAVISVVLVTCGIIVGVAGNVGDAARGGVPVTNAAPGVRKTLIHPGCVRMDGSTGSMNPLGWFVRKSLFGSRLDSILASSCQRGEKRSAHCPATITNRNPITRMIGMMIQSCRSRSIVFMAMSIDW